MSYLRKYIRQMLLVEVLMKDPMLQKALDQVLEVIEQDDPENVNTMLHLLEMHLDLAGSDELTLIEDTLWKVLEHLPESTPEVVEFLENNNLSKRQPIKLTISFLYSKGRDFENIRKALKMGAERGYHKDPIEDPRTPGGFGYKTGGSGIYFSNSKDAEEFVTFLDEIGMNSGARSYSQYNTKYVYPEYGKQPDLKLVTLWNG